MVSTAMLHFVSPPVIIETLTNGRFIWKFVVTVLMHFHQLRYFVTLCNTSRCFLCLCTLYFHAIYVYCIISNISMANNNDGFC